TTPYVVLLAAWAAFVHRITGDEALIVGTPTAARPHHRFGNVVGLFVNTVPLHFDFGRDISYEELLAAAKTQAREALDAQHLPLSRIVEAVQPARTANGKPLFETMFGLLADSGPATTGLTGAVLELPGTRLELGGLSLEVLPLPQTHAVAPLDMLVGEVEGA